MSEHSPAPSSARAVYGFAVFLLFHTLFIVYVFWAFTPTKILEEKFGLFYLPDKYFALYIPILILTATTIFAFFIYPSLNLMLTPNIDELCTVTDNFAIARCKFLNSKGIICDRPITKVSDSWNNIHYCEFHSFEGVIDKMKPDSHIMCDCCPAQKCRLREDPNFLSQLNDRPKIPSVKDIDTADVYNKILQI